MKKKTNKNHFSPVFANKHWTDQSSNFEYKYYYYCQHRKQVIDSGKDKGKTAWGYEYNLYSQELEDRLDSDLENHSSILYEKLINQIKLTPTERLKWSQFIITQAVRTPSFFKYRDYIETQNNGDFSYKNTILGCVNCIENQYVANRDWYILRAHKEDFFIRTDNPVYMTGFLENPKCTIFYPLTPELCFVACSYVENIPLLKGFEVQKPKQDIIQLEQGDTYTINFELIKSANNSIIVAKRNNNHVINKISLDVLGTFPQIPFFLSSASNDFAESIEIEKIINIMSIVDDIDYPYFKDYPFSPFYGLELSMGINPFSIFGVTNDNLKP